MQGYDIGISALRAHQQVLTTAGQNIVNSATPGYHRQRVNLVARRSFQSSGLLIGSGVDAAQLQRLRDVAVEQALLTTGSSAAAASTRSSLASQVEALFTPGTGSVHQRLTDFFNRLEDLSNAPANPTARRAFLDAANNLAQSSNGIANQLRQLQDSVWLSLEEGVDQVNSLMERIGEVDRQISIARTQGDIPNTLLDNRDQLLSELSSWVNVAVDEGASPPQPYQFANITQARGQVLQLRSVRMGEDTAGIVLEPHGESIEIASGKLHELLQQFQQELPGIRDRFAELAGTLMTEVNRIHATGMPAGAGFDSQMSANAVDNANNPLAGQLADAVQAGNLNVTITNTSTGVRSTRRLAIDPAVDSLDDVASQLDALNGVAAFLDPQGRLSIAAEPGFAFDFAGRLDTAPTPVSWSGTATITIGGAYLGNANDEWTYAIVGTGTVGVTSGLQLEVRNASGDLLAVRNIGQGYEPGTELDPIDGTALTISEGTVVGGDTMSSLVTSQPDETGLLAGLGLNTLFVGNSSTGYGIRRDLWDNPALIAISRTGETGDAAVAEQLLSLRTSRIAASGTLTPVEELASITAQAGLEAASAQVEDQFLADQKTQLAAQQQSVSGVNADEELVLIIEAQRSFQAAARYLTSLSEALDELLNLVR